MTRGGRFYTFSQYHVVAVSCCGDSSVLATETGLYCPIKVSMCRMNEP